MTVYDYLTAKYPNEQLLFVHDNAKPHIGKISGQIFKDLLFIRQSAYSPRTNLIEYGFGLFKKFYRKIQYRSKGLVKLQTMILNAFEMIKNFMFRYITLEMYDYLLHSLNQMK